MGNRADRMETENEKVSQIIPNEEIQRMKEALIDGDITEATERVRLAMEAADNVPLDIAITGESGVGKSTFINAMRGLRNREEGAAPTGVRQTTIHPTPYTHPRFSNVTFWDLPGIGTPDFKANEYLKKVEFSKYDFFIIMGTQRFTENQLLLADAVRSKKKNYYLIRSKIDCDLQAAERTEEQYDEERTKQEIREDLIQGLRDHSLQGRHIFLISSFYPQRYDFPRLQETLQRELPSHKRDIFVRCLPAISGQVLEMKKKVLQRRIWEVSLVSAGIAAIPVPGLSFACDIAILLGGVKLILDDFGLTMAHLHALSLMYNKDVNELKSVIKTPFFNLEINKELIIKMLMSAAATAGMVVEYFLSTIPIIGTVAAGAISFGTTYGMLKNFLNEIAADSEKVLAKALEGVV